MSFSSDDGKRLPRDVENRAWLADLRGEGGRRERAIARLHELLLRACRFEVNRRRAGLGGVGADELDDLATQAADDALVAVIGKLDDFRGESRFTTWAYKFALFEAGVKLRRRAWQDREVVLAPETWDRLIDPAPQVEAILDDAETLRLLRDAVSEELSPRQRQVFIALALNGVPIDVLAERMETTRGALYKVLHDARRKLRAVLAREGHPPGARVEAAAPGEREAPV